MNNAPYYKTIENVTKRWIIMLFADKISSLAHKKKNCIDFRVF